MGRFNVIAVSAFLVIGAAVCAVYVYRSPNRQSPDCVDAHNCLPHYANTTICKSLPVGTPERDLVFRLGQPIKHSGSTLHFESGAEERGHIEVELDSVHNAVRFFCDPAQPPSG
jgi:hypothetical protein